MKILAIESSCDESCVAIIDTESEKILADIVHSHVAATQRFGGIVPEVISREHIKALPLAYVEALKASDLKDSDIDWIAVTGKPGLIGSLLVGVSFAKGLAYALKKPFSTLSHIEAHLYSPLIEREKAPPFPWIALVVSGGHTELFKVDSEAEFEWLGGTVDDAAGEAFDKIGKLLGMGYPAGPVIDRLVRESHFSGEPLNFPIANTDGFNFSFSGLKTAVSLSISKNQPLTPENTWLIAKGAQEAILGALVKKVKVAQLKYGISSVVVTGGVACNSRLRTLLEKGTFPSSKYCSDNGAMVALLASLRHKSGRLAPSPWNEAPSRKTAML